MQLKKGIHPRLEQLEDRCVPSLMVNFSGGNLSITGTPTSGTLNLTQTATGGIQVLDNATSLGTFAVTGNLSSITGNAATKVNLTLAAGHSIPGNVTIDTGNGSDIIDVEGNGTGRIGGMLFINSGSGADVISIGLASGISVGGFTNLASSSGAVVNIGDGVAADSFGGELLVSKATLFQLGGIPFAGQTGTATVLGDLIVNDTGFTKLGITALGGGATVDGNVNILGGSGGSQVILDATVNSTAHTSTYVSLGNGPDSFALGGFNPATVDGNLTVYGGSTSNMIQFGAGSSVGGNVVLSLGNGVNTYTLTSAFTVNGNMSILAGADGNAIGTFGGTVNGDLTITLGSGTNSFDFEGVVGGASLKYTGGTGTDSVTIGGSNSFNLNVNLGGGFGGDVFTYGPGVTVGAATIDFGPHTGTDTYNDGGNTITWPQVIRNFP